MTCDDSADYAGVVKTAMGFKYNPKFSRLVAVGIKPKLERFVHSITVLGYNCHFNIVTTMAKSSKKNY